MARKPTLKCSVENCEREVQAKGLCQRHYMRLRRSGKLTTTRRMGDFWDKVRKGGPGECWPWTGYVKPSGHGLTSMKGTPMHTSRKAWILSKGRIAPGLQVNHKCDNALCCNPEHMYLGTQVDNLIDLWRNPVPEERKAHGRPTILSPAELSELYRMRTGGAKLKECAEKFGVHVATVCRYITEMRREKLSRLRTDRLARARAIQI